MMLDGRLYGQLCRKMCRSVEKWVTPSPTGMLHGRRASGKSLWEGRVCLPLLHTPRHGAHLFLQPPDFVAHAFPEVDALGGRPMALHIVPPGHGLGGTAKHDTRYFPVQERDAPVNQRFELHRV